MTAGNNRHSPTATWSRWAIEVSIQQLPDGRDGVLLQFKHGFLIIPDAVAVEDLAQVLVDAAKELRSRQQAGEGGMGGR